ncbi:alkylated DNA repair protein alkB homolog 8 [Diorhabda carinulata]|uniref:alkylated DNA repair protein alkB homolog 8 n=1 Tax=Diorhabda carinulata TaxID=1163345 RepID=UPI0025A2B661|nr:alkylated DNA repair protein alkB homolog 8 [Diorhabda carinulata]
MEHDVLSAAKLKKIEKKLKKLLRIVFQEVGIQCSINKVNKIIAIANAGLINGLTEETVFEYFSKYGALQHILLIPGKSCCFVQYKEEASAVKAYNNYNGILNIAQDSKPIYLLYADKLPDLCLKNMWHGIVPGLIILNNFVTSDEEKVLLQLCSFDSNTTCQMRHRQVKHFGYEFRYDTNNVDKDKPLPESIPGECNLWERLKNTEYYNFVPDQLTINHYIPGQGIPHHVDTHSAFDDPIMSLSLGSSVVMEFKKDDQHICILLPQRSLAIMSGESRYDWTHGITPRKFDIVPTENGFTSLERGVRTSFTFRKVLQGSCTCNYKSKCDSYMENSREIKNNDASELEKEHVHKVYENIAEHFDDTRHKPWPNVVHFLESFEKGSLLIDVGCGNGKYLGSNEDIFNIGCDTSFNLIDICRKRGFQSFIASCLNLPLRDSSVDGAISIAVIHHLANEERRIKAIKEIVRILKPGGKALIYVWAKDQCKNQGRTTYIKQDRKNRKENSNIVTEYNNEMIQISEKVSLPIHINRTQFKHDDMLVPWKLKRNKENDRTFLRFYHVFVENELDNLCKKIKNVVITKSYYDQGNWCVIINKI